MIGVPNASAVFTRQGTDLAMEPKRVRVLDGGKSVNYPALLNMRWVVRFDSRWTYADGQPVRVNDHLSFHLDAEPAGELHAGSIGSVLPQGGAGHSIALCNF